MDESKREQNGVFDNTVLFVSDLDLTLTTQHSGGGVPRSFEKEKGYESNVRDPEVIQTQLHQLADDLAKNGGHLVFSIATSGINQPRVIQSLKTMGFDDQMKMTTPNNSQINALHIGGGMDQGDFKDKIGKNAHIIALLGQHFESTQKLPSVVLLYDDNSDNVNFFPNSFVSDVKSTCEGKDDPFSKTLLENIDRIAIASELATQPGKGKFNKNFKSVCETCVETMDKQLRTEHGLKPELSDFARDYITDPKIPIQDQTDESPLAQPGLDMEIEDFLTQARAIITEKKGSSIEFTEEMFFKVIQRSILASHDKGYNDFNQVAPLLRKYTSKQIKAMGKVQKGFNLDTVNNALSTYSQSPYNQIAAKDSEALANALVEDFTPLLMKPGPDHLPTLVKTDSDTFRDIRKECNAIYNELFSLPSSNVAETLKSIQGHCENMQAIMSKWDAETREKHQIIVNFPEKLLDNMAKIHVQAISPAPHEKTESSRVPQAFLDAADTRKAEQQETQERTQQKDSGSQNLNM